MRISEDVERNLRLRGFHEAVEAMEEAIKFLYQKAEESAQFLPNKADEYKAQIIKACHNQAKRSINRASKAEYHAYTAGVMRPDKPNLKIAGS